MPKFIKYFLLGQVCGYGGIALSMLILPEGLRANAGVSYFGAHWETIGPFGGGLLIMTVCAIRVCQYLPKSAFYFKLQAMIIAVLLFSVAVIPFGSTPWMASAHERLSELLFLFQLVMAGYVAVVLRRNVIGFGLVAAGLFSAIVTLSYWAPDMRMLYIGELITQAIFSISTFYGLQRYAADEIRQPAPTKPRRAVLAGQEGFTIIELTIATTVFSMVLLLCSYGLIQIGRTYNKGVTTARTQEAARSIVDEISRSIQFSGGTIATTPASVSDGTPYILCIDEQRYSIVTDRQIKDSPQNSSQTRNALVVDTYPGCNASSPVLPVNDQNFSITSVSGARELLPDSLRLARLSLTYRGTNLYDLTIRVVAGEDDVLDAAHDNCLNVRAGNQFCAVSELTTVVQKRL